ncbi:MAG: hypothetical protein NTU83_14195 [Candidatus Hydrogenedentes bacterium]|nr:hypothetical protein [Candidatus Hydrogenedentota bacterium]
MSVRKMLLVVVLCVVVCICVGLAAQPVFAQDDLKLDRGGKGDSKLSTKQGLDVLKGSGKDKPKATTVQMIVGVGSIFVTVAIVKWL